MRAFSYFNSALKIISAYRGEMPLHNFLKKYFSAEKKFGSKDRKFITQLCYNYFRLGHALNELQTQERLKIAIFLCNKKEDVWNDLFDEKWKDNGKDNLDKRINFVKKIYPDFSVESIFYLINESSESLDATGFARSHLIQPDLFIRIRNGNERNVFKKLQENKIEFTQLKNDCTALLNSTKLENVFEINKEVVVQDFSSQRISEFFSEIKINQQENFQVWDCCAASGGKSILAFDYFKNLLLTVSDIRSSIIANLKKRFHEAGIKNYRSFIADLTVKEQLPINNFNLVICDAPCTGSGTWSRTPEQLYFFKEKQIDYYASLQKKMISNAISNVKNGGYFLYITCSVFKKENEDAVEFIRQNFSFQLIKKELLQGFEMKADTMFAALLKKI